MTYHQLSEYERYAIARLLRQGYSKRRIALVLGRHPTTIIREIERDATNHDGAYRPEEAHQYAIATRRRIRRILQ